MRRGFRTRVRDEQGKAFTVRYEAVNAMLLNEFLKEHRKGEQQDRQLAAQEAVIAELKAGLQALAAAVKEQDAHLQEVSARLTANKPAPPLLVAQE